ncbi:MAG: HNH endonuclease signature motif containing protein [Pseudonocardiaceae bacterium]
MSNITYDPFGCFVEKLSFPLNGCFVPPIQHPYGYSVIWVKGTHVRAHRYMYERCVGPIPEGKELDHLCRNKGCVRPSHLEVVTHKENSRRALVKTHCVNGHPLTGDNLYFTGSRRACKICSRARNSRNKAKRKGITL